MKSEIFASGLNAYAKLVNSKEERSIKSLAVSFKSIGSPTVKVALTRLRTTYPPSKATNSRSSCETPLSGLSDLLAVWGSKAAIADVTFLQETLSEYSDLSLSDLADKLHQANQKKPKVKRSPAPIDESLVHEYANALENSTSKPSEFEAVFAKLKADKRLRLPMELTKIANDFYGTDLRYKTKSEALKVIQRRHLQDRRLSEEDREFRVN